MNEKFASYVEETCTQLPPGTPKDHFRRALQIMGNIKTYDRTFTIDMRSLRGISLVTREDVTRCLVQENNGPYALIAPPTASTKDMVYALYNFLSL